MAHIKTLATMIDCSLCHWCHPARYLKKENNNTEYVTAGKKGVRTEWHCRMPRLELWQRPFDMDMTNAEIVKIARAILVAVAW